MKLEFKKLSVVIVTAVLLSTLLGTQLVSTASADTQEIMGKLAKADYRIRIPDNWEGNLVVVCRGYSPEVPTSWNPNSFWQLLGQGYMIAESNYGVGGYCVKEGVIRTHQLTEYVLDHYPVTGKVLLVGMSMGGNIALELGVKYPHLYDGVLDIAGTKDLKTQYYDKMYYASLTDYAELAAAIIANGGAVPAFPLVPPYVVTPEGWPGTDLEFQLFVFREFCLGSAGDIADACGGTPDEKPKAYERVSPTFSAADLAIPTITVHGTKDTLVPYSASVAFEAAVAANGASDLYRLYTVVNGEHCNMPVMQKTPVCIPLLLDWVENGNPAPATTPW
jgi:pimeloyl-ACP methyl ester carboxylesterase